MEAFFEREYYLRTSDFDKRRRFKPSSALDLFQDVAGCHAIALGCGYDDLIEKNLLWVVTKIKYKVLCEPSMFELVRVATWPCEPNRAGFRREYTISRQNGEELIIGSSDWVVIDAKTRRFVPAHSVYPEGVTYKTERNFEDRLAKIPDFSAETAEEITPGFTQIDLNGHLNNTVYASLAEDILSPEANEAIDTFQIDYRHEVREYDRLALSLLRDGGGASVRGAIGDHPAFLCRIEWKK